MVKKILILIIIFYFLALIQTSFLIHFNILGTVPNLILILVCLLSFFEKPKEYWGIFGALLGGFFLDIFSNSFMGLAIISLLIVSFFIKKSLHFLKETPEKHPFHYFLPLLFFSLIFYDLFFGIIFYFLYLNSFQFNLGLTTLIKIFYNLSLGFFGFYFYKKGYGISQKI